MCMGAWVCRCASKYSQSNSIGMMKMYAKRLEVGELTWVVSCYNSAILLLHNLGTIHRAFIY